MGADDEVNLSAGFDFNQGSGTFATAHGCLR